MRRGPLPSPKNRGRVFALYLALAVAAVVVLRLLGRGWVGAITAGLVVAGVLATLLVLLGSRRGR
jgi:hypothetical protein